MGFLSNLFGYSEPPKDDPFSQLRYDVPYGWSGEVLDTEDGAGILLLAPDIEANWQANIFVEVRVDLEHRKLADSLDDLVPNLRANKPDFRLISTDIFWNRNEVEIGRIEYSGDSEGTALTEWELVIPFDSEFKFFIMASAATECWPKYRHVFLKFAESVDFREE
ncbi:MAG: hypothetical protein KDA69_21270 [Planctomycetaceae bacterium]|nr:hypothetical protein [Planctomycetaceae bacterium]MCA9046875.1 hypothetical protein [Planctomycetaceae bacterium]